MFDKQTRFDVYLRKSCFVNRNCIIRVWFGPLFRTYSIVVHLNECSFTLFRFLFCFFFSLFVCLKIDVFRKLTVNTRCHYSLCASGWVLLRRLLCWLSLYWNLNRLLIIGFEWFDFFFFALLNGYEYNFDFDTITILVWIVIGDYFVRKKFTFLLISENWIKAFAVIKLASCIKPIGAVDLSLATIENCF